MTEQEYIDVSNLVRIRSAKDLIRGALPMAGLDDDDWSVVMKHLSRWERRLESKSLCDADSATDQHSMGEQK